MGMEHSPVDEESVVLHGVNYTHGEICRVIEVFYGRVQKDRLLHVPFQSVQEWPHHIQRIVHFWWVRMGGKPYLNGLYNPGLKHFEAGFNREFLARWLEVFHESLRVHLNPKQVELWQSIAERMGEALSLKNDLMLRMAAQDIH